MKKTLAAAIISFILVLSFAALPLYAGDASVSESAEKTESVMYPDDPAQTAPYTIDSAAILCLVFSSLSAAGILVCRNKK